MRKTSNHLVTRRKFVKVLAGAALSTALVWNYPPLAKLFGIGASPATARKWVMVVDQAKCIGCNFCTFACKAVNDTPPDIYWNMVYVEKTIGTKMVYIPRPCMHCEDPPCVMVCPDKATYQRETDGLVVIDYNKCIGCRYCMAACPYGARYFNWKEPTEKNQCVPQWGKPEVPRRPRGVVEKCTFCMHRIDNGVQKGLTPGVDPEATPACVNICPTGARNFGDLDSIVGHPKFGEVPRSVIRSEGVQPMKELGVRPRAYYLPP